MIIVLHNVLFRKQVVKLQLFLETTITNPPKVCKSHFLPLHCRAKAPQTRAIEAKFREPMVDTQRVRDQEGHALFV